MKRSLLASVVLVLAAMLAVPALSAGDAVESTNAGGAATAAPAKHAPPVVLDQPSTLQQGLEWAEELLLLRIGNNEAGRIIASFIILLGTVILRRIVIVFFFAFLRKLAKRTENRFDDRILAAIQAPASSVVLVVGMFMSVMVLNLPPLWDERILFAFKASLMVVVFWGFLRGIDVVSDVLTEVAKEKDLGIATFAPLLKKTARFFFLVIGAILIVQNLGYSVGSLLAGLGIGGLAVALAAQDSLANFFGSIVVAVDRPMKVGDFVTIGNYSGTVEEVGLRSTRLRTRERTLVTIPNKTMANEVIENYSAISRRRIELTIGVTYDTTTDQMEKVLADLRKVLAEEEAVDQSEMQVVRFNDFGASSLDIRVIYYAKRSDFAGSLEVREKVNLELMRTVLAHGLSFAFPTQTLYLEGEIARKMAEGRGGPAASNG